MTKRMIDADDLEIWLNEKRDYITNTIIDSESYMELIDFIDNTLMPKINELATSAPEPQENIYDSDGWCWDMDKAPVTAIGCLIKFFDILVLKKYHVGTQNECKQYERIADVWLDYELKLKDKDQQKLNIADVSILAWRPILTLPKGGLSD